MFKDHFSKHAELYATARPGYPADLYESLARLAPVTSQAWDAGCGNGQVAYELAGWFDSVHATDPSETQIQQARLHPRIDYRCEPAEACSLPDDCCGLVTTAQAAHWFDLDRFYAEAMRVLVSGGVLAVWCYGLCTVTPEVDVIYRSAYSELLGDYWPPERHLPENNYRDLDFPFQRLTLPDFAMTCQWTADQFLAYMESWSATRRYFEDRGVDPIQNLAEPMRQAWGPATRTVSWPLTVLATRAG